MSDTTRVCALCGGVIRPEPDGVVHLEHGTWWRGQAGRIVCLAKRLARETAARQVAERERDHWKHLCSRRIDNTPTPENNQ